MGIKGIKCKVCGGDCGITHIPKSEPVTIIRSVTQSPADMLVEMLETIPGVRVVDVTLNKRGRPVGATPPLTAAERQRRHRARG